jgi:poly(3-hydroxybutyrate) depolymerase
MRIVAKLDLLLLTMAIAMTPPQTAPFEDCSEAADGHQPHNGTNGTFAATFHEVQWLGHPMYVLVPSEQRAFPLVVFMHGSTGQFGMYADNLRTVCTHGFIVVFPFIKSPAGDKNPLTTNTDGEFILRGIDFAIHAAANQSSPLFAKVDTSRVVVSGHSVSLRHSSNLGGPLVQVVHGAFEPRS